MNFSRLCPDLLCPLPSRKGSRSIPGCILAHASLLLLLLIGLQPVCAATKSSIAFPGSIRRIPTASEIPAGSFPQSPFISRPNLSAAEQAEAMTVEVALRMRNFAELQARIAKGEIIAPSEMQSRYLPSADDQRRLVTWLTSQGLQIVSSDPSHLAVFVRAPVSAVARAFNTSFARVSVDATAYSAAISAPSLPSDLASSVLGIHGLQPYQHIHLLNHLAPLAPQAVVALPPPYLPSQITRAYDAANIGLSGSGQTIAIFAAAYPASSDLNAFWALASSTASASNVTHVDLNGGPSSSPGTGTLEEAALDIEWAGAIAPGAAIRVYGANLADSAALDEMFLQVYADLASIPSLHQLSISFGYGEAEADQDYLLIESQYVAALASAGVTVVASSGDLGAYADSALPSLLQVNYPACDPDVTGVGGTSISINSDGSVASESAWSGTGGGISSYFSRPSWQIGTGVPAGTKRLVPDVAAAGDPSTGAVIYVSGKQMTVGGTSWAAPTWASFCALINQNRASSGLAPLGALNPRLYPLLGSSSFRDITSGSNGTYTATPGYDLCTGIGVPDVGHLLQSTLGANTSPSIIAQYGARFTTIGQSATFAVSVVGNTPLSYLWRRLPTGSALWSDLSDGTNYSGSSTPALLVSHANSSMSGDSFECVVSNASGSSTSIPAVLTVASTGVSTLAGWAGAFGTQDGLSSNARFNFTGSVRTDSSGNVYVADAQNFTIRKIDPSGLVSTLAGLGGVSGTADGPAASARFGGAGGVAIDASGNVYVADSGNYTIRKISPDGMVSTLAGRAGISGHLDGSGASAEFVDPENLAVDSNGDIYVADGKGNTVRFVTPAGLVSTLAGSSTKGAVDGPASAARFYMPTGVVVDSSGNVYVGDSGNDAIRIIHTDGTVSTLAGSLGVSGSADGTGTTARFNLPSGLAIDSSGNIYVADSGNSTIRKITSSGVVTTVAGSATASEGTDGPPLSARFAQPADVAIDSAGVLYVADSLNNSVRRIVLSTLNPPSIATNPVGADTPAGSSVVLSVSASGSAPLLYQWSKDGVAVAGATSTSLSLSNLSSLDEGSYACTVTNDAGSSTSASASLVVDPLVNANPAARLSSISSRTYVDTGVNALVAGISISGSEPKTVLIRAAGPALQPYGISNYLPDPVLTLQDATSGSILASNDNWSSDPTQAATLSSTFTQTSAFAWPSGSKDAALLVTLQPGLYTATVQDKNGANGVALVEVYEVDQPAPRLVDISTRSEVQSGNNVQVAGFVISGTGLKTVLIRSSGPSLAPYGISTYVPDPVLTLYNQAGATLATNDNWGDDAHKAPLIQAAAAATGAFAWPTGSKDSALLVTLPPGLYSAITKDKNGGQGVGLIEVYEVK